MRGVGGVRKSIHQSWLAKGLGLVLGLLCWGFKGVQEEIPWEKASHSSDRVSGISTRTIHQSTTPSLSQTIWPRLAYRQFLTLRRLQTLLPVTFAYSLSSEAVVMGQLRRWKKLWRRSLTGSHKSTSMGPSGSCWNGKQVPVSRKRLLWRWLEFHVCTTYKSTHTKKSGNLFNDPLIFFLWELCSASQ